MADYINLGGQNDIDVGEITTEDLADDAVTAPKLADDAVVNANVAASAAIARTKLASGTASHVLINDGSGVMSSEVRLAVSRGGTNSSTALSNNRIMVSSSSAIVEATAITASRALKSDSNGIPVHFDTASEPSLTELSYVKNVTSAIQTQLDAKLSKSGGTMTGAINVYRTETAVSTNSAGQTIIGVTDTSALRTITLDTDDLVAGRVLIIKDQSGGAAGNNITIDTEGSEKIDGADSITISANYGVARLYSNGTHWFTF